MRCTVSVDVPVPMRDGTALITDLWLPEADGPVPVLLVRSPYGKRADATAQVSTAAVEAGYAH